MALSRWLEALTQDFRYAARMSWRNPVFTLAAVLSLALGIGATTMMFSVIHAVVLEPFPYRDPDTLLSMGARNAKGMGLGFNYQTDDFAEIAERTTGVFDGVIASTISDVLMIGQGEPERLRGNYVTMNTFDVMGVPPLLGRGSTAEDAKTGAPPIAVLGYTFWQRRFGGSADVLGKSLLLNGDARTVVGVMPPRFMWRGADVYMPVMIERGRPIPGVRTVHLMGRLKPGVTRAQAESALRPIFADIWTRHPELEAGSAFQVRMPSFKESSASGLRDALFILLGAVSLLLLIACVNVSNLLLARASAREREMAIRTSLGAGRARLVRQLLTESLVLATAGAIVGIGFAYAGLAGLLRIIPPDYVPSEADISLNRPVLIGTVLLALVSAVIFGLAPALQTARRDVMNPLRETGRGVVGSGRQARLRGALVSIEVALAVVLLVGAGLLMRTLVNMQSVDTQVQPDRVLTMRVPLPVQRYATPEARARFFESLVERVGQLPGVEAAGASAGLPLFGARGTRVTVAGQPTSDRRSSATEVTAGYFRVANLQARKGRLLTADDVSGRRQVGVVNEAFVRRYFGADDPLGRVVHLDYLKQPPNDGGNDAIEVIGVVADQLPAGVGETDDAFPEIFLPHALTGGASYLLVSTALPPRQLERAIRHEVYALDKEQPVTDVRTMRTMLDEFTFAVPRFNLLLLGIFAALGLALATIGIYGVISYAVSQRTQEIGIRLALGAQRSDVVKMVLASGLRLVLVGLVLGCLGAFGAMRLLASQLWNVSTYDPLSFALVIAILLTVGLQACLWPARRAARVDPMVAVRHE